MDASSTDSGATGGDAWVKPAAGLDAWGTPSGTSSNVLAGRYEILEMLGEGGMGAVYKARDVELDRFVAVKVIRPELAAQKQVLKRFKQELILARAITHKNVIRIYDLGEAAGSKFITMEYIVGKDLKQMVQEKGKLSSDETVPILQQILRALNAAHSEGIVHRDMKPQNVMVDQQGVVTVMDFGIARSMEASGVTRAGALLGTPAYMSPEQAKGLPADARSDLFAVGVIAYEMLTGNPPFEAETAMATMLKRIQERATPLEELDPSIPRNLSSLVSKLLERDPENRYQNAREVLEDLETRRTPRTSAGDTLVPIAGATPAETIALPLAAATPRGKAVPWTWLAAGALGVAIAVIGFLIRDKISPHAPARQEAVSVLVADFQNATGESVFDGSLEPMFILAMEGAKFINGYDRGAARRIAAQLQPGATKLDEPLARLVAVRDGIHYVVSGSVNKEGESYRLSIRVTDAINGKIVLEKEVKGANKEGVMPAVSKLAAQVRNALGDTTPESQQVAAAETFSAASLEAAHYFSQGQDQLWAGKPEEAAKFYSQAVELDPNLGRAYASLAAVNLNLGQREQAEKYYRLAVARIDRMTDREKYRTRGIYYLMSGNQQKAIEEFSALLKQYAGDTGGLSNLPRALHDHHEMEHALEEGRRAVQIYPKNLLLRNNLGGLALHAGDFATAEKEARAVLEANPSYVFSHLNLALAELGQGRATQAEEAYHKAEAVNARGASHATMGLAGVAMYEGRLKDAAATLDKGIAADLSNDKPALAAKKLAVLATADSWLGQQAPALKAADRAVAAHKEVSVLFLAAEVYLAAGQEPKARTLAMDLAKRADPDPQAYAQLIDGEIQRKHKDLPGAIKQFRDAQKIADTWLGRFLLGRAYVESDQFTEGYSELELCLKRRGEATEGFLDDVPTYWFVPPVYYYMGRAQDGLKSSGAAESFRTFLALKEKDQGDPLAADARRRLSGR